MLGDKVSQPEKAQQVSASAHQPLFLPEHNGWVLPGLSFP